MKSILKKIFLYTLGILVIPIFFVVVISLINKKNLLPKDESLKSNCTEFINSSIHTLPDNINAPPQIRKAILEVLNRYPELQNEKITFSYKKITTTMATRPVVDLNIFLTTDRKYSIIVNKEKSDNRTTFNFDSLKYEYQVAWIAHEFGHIVDYKDRNLFSLIGLGVNYLLNQEFKREVEAFAHKSAIFHGFGEETYQSVKFAFESKNISGTYKTDQKKTYMDTVQVRKLILEYEEKCSAISKRK